MIYQDRSAMCEKICRGIHLKLFRLKSIFCSANCVGGHCISGFKSCSDISLLESMRCPSSLMYWFISSIMTDIIDAGDDVGCSNGEKRCPRSMTQQEGPGGTT